MKEKRYFVGTRWGCSMDGPYESCSISYATKEDEEVDGWNFVCKGGNEGEDYFIANSLEEALVHSHFNPCFIKFYELDEEDLALKDEILKVYKWDKVHGLIKEK